MLEITQFCFWLTRNDIYTRAYVCSWSSYYDTEEKDKFHKLLNFNP